MSDERKPSRPPWQVISEHLARCHAALSTGHMAQQIVQALRDAGYDYIIPAKQWDDLEAERDALAAKLAKAEHHREYVAADDLTAFLAEKDAVCGEPETLPTGRVVTCTKPRGHLAHSAPGCVWEHPGYTRARSERDVLMAKLRRVRARLDVSARQADAVADVPWPECLPALVNAYSDALNAITTILDGSGDE